MTTAHPSAPLLRKYFTKELKDAHLVEVDKLRKLSRANLVEMAVSAGLDVEQFKAPSKPKKPKQPPVPAADEEESIADEEFEEEAAVFKPKPKARAKPTAKRGKAS
jgi:hypothetical protein